MNWPSLDTILLFFFELRTTLSQLHISDYHCFAKIFLKYFCLKISDSLKACYCVFGLTLWYQVQSRNFSFHLILQIYHFLLFFFVLQIHYNYHKLTSCAHLAQNCKGSFISYKNDNFSIPFFKIEKLIHRKISKLSCQLYFYPQR